MHVKVSDVSPHVHPVSLELTNGTEHDTRHKTPSRGERHIRSLSFASTHALPHGRRAIATGQIKSRACITQNAGKAPPASAIKWPAYNKLTRPTNLTSDFTNCPSWRRDGSALPRARPHPPTSASKSQTVKQPSSISPTRTIRALTMLPTSTGPTPKHTSTRPLYLTSASSKIRSAPR